MQQQISFPREQELHSEKGGVKFPAILDGRRVMCWISREALDNHFEAKTKGELHAFLRHRGEIEAEARKLIEQQEFLPDGSILIGTLDMGPTQGQ